MVKWSGLSHEQLEVAEIELIRLSGVDVEPSRIYLDESENYSIFCLKCGDTSNPALVLLHGYLGTSIIFYKILKDLSEKYRVYCLDLMGMGRSSRPDFTAEGPEETELFFIIPLEQCIVKLGLKSIILAGHSFGGYIAGCYTEAFPDRVEKLILISPLGIPAPPGELSPKEWMKKRSWGIRTVTKIAKYLVSKGITPASILRKLGPFSSNLVRLYVQKRWRNLPQEDLKHLEVYLEQVNLYPGSGEYALKEIVVEGAYAIKPLYNRITNTPVLFIYGDWDWMDRAGAEQNAKKNSSRVICEIISGSGHHMYIDNPQELSEKIINGINSLEI
jgi:cardiolipin-specific phospholipase